MKKLALAWIHPGTVHSCFMDSVLALLQAPKTYDLALLPVHSGPLLSKARNIVVEEVIARTDIDYLLFADSDMAFTPQDVEALIKADKPIVGAVYYGRDNETQELFPVALKKAPDGFYRPVDRDMVPQKGCKRVDAVGMGLTLITRETLEALESDSQKLQPFAESVQDGHSVGEDVTFCLRAKQKGYRTWLCGDARAGHAKTFVIGA